MPTLYGMLNKPSNAEQIQLNNHFEEILDMIVTAQNKALLAVNSEVIELYWKVGEYISHKLEDAEWGDKTITQLATFITTKRPCIKGFNSRNLYRMKTFFESYKGNEIVTAVRSQISWTHHRSIFSQCKSPEERYFYMKLCIDEKLSTRELDRQIGTSIFERVVLSSEKMKLTRSRNLPEKAQSQLKDRYSFEFLDLPHNHDEKDLRQGLVSCLKEFLLELGSDFTFMGQEYRLQVGNSDFYVDLLFFHRELDCLVAFELKTEKFKPEHLGQLQFYIEALDRDVKKEKENPSIGILLCTSKDDAVVEYALSCSLTPTMVAEYETKLIPKELLQRKLDEFYALAEGDE